MSELSCLRTISLNTINSDDDDNSNDGDDDDGDDYDIGTMKIPVIKYAQKRALPWFFNTIQEHLTRDKKHLKKIWSDFKFLKLASFWSMLG